MWHTHTRRAMQAYDWQFLVVSNYKYGSLATNDVVDDCVTHARIAIIDSDIKIIPLKLSTTPTTQQITALITVPAFRRIRTAIKWNECSGDGGGGGWWWWWYCGRWTRIYFARLMEQWRQQMPKYTLHKQLFSLNIVAGCSIIEWKEHTSSHHSCHFSFYMKTSISAKTISINGSTTFSLLLSFINNAKNEWRSSEMVVCCVRLTNWLWFDRSVTSYHWVLHQQDITTVYKCSVDE